MENTHSILIAKKWSKKCTKKVKQLTIKGLLMSCILTLFDFEGIHQFICTQLLTQNTHLKRRMHFGVLAEQCNGGYQSEFRHSTKMPKQNPNPSQMQPTQICQFNQKCCHIHNFLQKKLLETLALCFIVYFFLYDRLRYKILVNSTF